MFIAIEGDGDQEREDQMNKGRHNLSLKLWNLTCCQINVFNQTEFQER